MASEDADASYNGMKQRVMDEVRQMFKPEFLNRIDEIIVFRQLTKENMGKIVDIMLKDVTGRMKTQMNITAEISDDAKQLLIERGYDEKYGAKASQEGDTDPCGGQYRGKRCWRAISRPEIRC